MTSIATTLLGWWLTFGLLEPVTSPAGWDAAMQDYEHVRAAPYDGDKDGDEHPHTVTSIGC